MFDSKSGIYEGNKKLGVTQFILLFPTIYTKPKLQYLIFWQRLSYVMTYYNNSWFLHPILFLVAKCDFLLENK